MTFTFFTISKMKAETIDPVKLILKWLQHNSLYQFLMTCLLFSFKSLLNVTFYANNIKFLT